MNDTKKHLQNPDVWYGENIFSMAIIYRSTAPEEIMDPLHLNQKKICSFADQQTKLHKKIVFSIINTKKHVKLEIEVLHAN